MLGVKSGISLIANASPNEMRNRRAPVVISRRIVCFSGEERHTGATGTGHDQFERAVPVFGAGPFQSGPAGKREASADGGVAAKFVAPARGVWMGRWPVRQSGAPATLFQRRQRASPPAPAPSAKPAAVPAAPLAVPTISTSVPADAKPLPAHATATVAVAVLPDDDDDDTTAAATATPAVRGRCRPDGRVGRGRVRAVRQNAPDAGARVAQRKRPRVRDRVRRGHGHYGHERPPATGRTVVVVRIVRVFRVVGVVHDVVTAARRTPDRRRPLHGHCSSGHGGRRTVSANTRMVPRGCAVDGVRRPRRR